VSKDFLREMAQPYEKNFGLHLLSSDQIAVLQGLDPEEARARTAAATEAMSAAADAAKKIAAAAATAATAESAPEGPESGDVLAAATASTGGHASKKARVLLPD
jgi:hypothetical protein